MSDRLATLLSELTSNAAWRPFLRQPHVGQDGFLTLFVEDVPSYGDRINDGFTVFRSRDTDEIVGFEVKIDE